MAVITMALYKQLLMWEVRVFSRTYTLFIFGKLQAQNRLDSCFSIHNGKGPSLRPRKSAINNAPISSRIVWLRHDNSAGVRVSTRELHLIQ